MGVLALGASNVVAVANTDVIGTHEETKQSESAIAGDEESINHTVTLQRTNPITEVDEYAWMLVSEPGQLGYSINALGLGNPDPSLFEDETVMLFEENGIELSKIYNKLGLENEDYTSDKTPLVLTYSQQDIGDTVSTTVTNLGGKDDIDVARTTGSFSKTLKANEGFEASAQEKDDSEQTAYLTVSTLSPTAYQDFNGIYARVCDYNNDVAMTAWTCFRSTGKYELYYRTFDGEAGTKYYLAITNTNDRAIDVAVRWTP